MIENPPLAYLITFTCYGTRLHGDEAGSVHRRCNVPGTPVLPASRGLERYEQERLTSPPYVMDGQRRAIVLTTVQEVCGHREWKLVAAHIRPTHVHLVVGAAADPERVSRDLKAYASRALNASGLDGEGCRRWTEYASTRYLWRHKDMMAAANYVIHGQGDQLDVFPTSM